MRALIYEPSGAGHRFQHVRLLAGSILALGGEVAIATSNEWSDSPEFTTHLAEIADRVALDEKVVVADGSPLKVALDKARNLKRAIQRTAADHVYMPYADGTAQILGYLHKFGVGRHRDVEAEGLLMRCAAAYQPPSLRGRVRRFLWSHPLTSGAWSALHFLDPAAFEVISRAGVSSQTRIGIIPEPVEPMEALSKAEARRRLGIPEDGRYIGTCGGLDTRKGIDRLLHAFANAKLARDDRLLLVGKARCPIDQLLSCNYRSLVEAGQIIVIDRYVSEAELEASFYAMDVVCTPYPRHIGSSGIVVRAAAAGRPVLSASFGWVGNATQKFGLGLVCSVNDGVAFAEAVNKSIATAEDYVLPEPGRRFVQYHTAKNYAATWTRRWRERAGLPPDPDRIDWSWVTETLRK